MNNSDRIIEIVSAVLSEHHLFRTEPEVTADSSLDDLRADDLDKMGIVMRVEEKFEFIISDKDERKLTSVSDIIALVERRTQGIAA